MTSTFEGPMPLVKGRGQERTIYKPRSSEVNSSASLSFELLKKWKFPFNELLEQRTKLAIPILPKTNAGTISYNDLTSLFFFFPIYLFQKNILTVANDIYKRVKALEIVQPID
ncbi:hypothetical protein L1049_028294 [Liquidambar formosana]|uniref:Uncharacterized protein n=1 Tax=Liquidambar formosana TaxID=63359 RepID=A0AAP0RK12_LIQFO